jgi:hypothetical protein
MQLEALTFDTWDAGDLCRLSDFGGRAVYAVDFGILKALCGRPRREFTSLAIVMVFDFCRWEIFDCRDFPLILSLKRS